MAKHIQFSIRGVQLDLARQMETIKFIKEFIDFIAENGYNTLVLYLEGRIRTEIFPFPTREESYSPEEMKDVVAYAAGKNIDIIPVVSTLGHAELFLKHRKMQDFAELRNGASGRFGGSALRDFCPSQPGTLEFFEAYLKEICDIFPSKYFHIGGDETWDMAICDLCYSRANTEGLSGIYSSYINECHKIVSGKLGRRMIIWDDMFEYFPDALDCMPRDIIMCCWQYGTSRDLPVGHFLNRTRHDWLAEYEKRGFEYIIAPADYSIENISLLTRYGARHKPLGGLLTTWEKSDAFVYQSLPDIAFAGRLWKGGRLDSDKAIVKSLVKDIFKTDSAELESAVHAMLMLKPYAERMTKLENFMVESEFGIDLKSRALNPLLTSVFQRFYKQCDSETAERIIEDYITALKCGKLHFELEELIPEFFKPGADIQYLETTLDKTLGDLEAVGKKRVAQWHKWRHGITPCGMQNIYTQYIDNMWTVPELAEKHGAMRVSFCLPDQFSAQRVRIKIRYADDAAQYDVACGVFKNTYSSDCMYTYTFLVEKDLIPDSIVVETRGFGGQGFTFFEVHNNLGTFVPGEISKITGVVIDPEFILDNDRKWLFAGEKNSRKAYELAILAEKVHGFEIKLKKQEI